MRKKRVIVWFRQDLRLHDNEALLEAISHGEEIIPVYVFDTRTFGGKTMFGFPKTGATRMQFIIDAVEDLRNSLRAIGSELIIRVGKPEDEVFKIAHDARTSWVFCNRERTREEVMVQDNLEKNLWSIGQEVRFSRGKMLYYTSDLPFPVTHAPDHFTTFRKETERIVNVRTPLQAPAALPRLTLDIVPGEIPRLVDFFEGPTAHLVHRVRGGEQEAMRRLDILKDTANSVPSGLDRIGLSPWLSQGCLSPKLLYQVLDKISRLHPDMASAMRGGLQYRDYLRLMGKKYGDVIFQRRGIAGEGTDISEKEMDLFWIWARGKTGLPIIDAGMSQLRTTGYLPHKVRLLAAYFLVRELGVAWRLGASYYESMLIDYDPCSNWVNWNNVAGVGPESRDVRKINYVLQAKRLDPHGDYVRRWIPALQNADHHWIHQPDQAATAQLIASDISLGQNYPYAVLSSDRWNVLSNGR